MASTVRGIQRVTLSPASHRPTEHCAYYRAPLRRSAAAHQRTIVELGDSQATERRIGEDGR